MAASPYCVWSGGLMQTLPRRSSNAAPGLDFTAPGLGFFSRRVVHSSLRPRACFSDDGGQGYAANELLRRLAVAPQRLDKHLVACGWNKSAAKAACREGRVALRRGGSTIGSRWKERAKGATVVSPRDDEVWVAGVQQTWCPPQVYALLHKPCGLLSAMSDPHGRPHIGQILPWGLENSGAHADGVRSVGNVGRLDAQTSGALLVTDDGLLHHLLTRPGSGVWKVYEARVWPAIGPEHAALEVLRHGVQLDGAESTPTLPARIEIAQQQPDDSLFDAETTVLRISLQQGQYRQVRRMLGAVHLKCVALERVQIGPLALGRHLRCGEWRSLAASEVLELYDAAGGSAVVEAELRTTLRCRLERGTVDADERNVISRWLHEPQTRTP